MFPDVPHTGLPLSGLRVIDCTIWQQGTYATAMLADMVARLKAAGLAARAAMADTWGAAHALARFAARPTLVVPAGESAAAIMPLPIAALRLPATTVDSLRRLGLDQIGDLERTPRAPLALRFGSEIGRRLDQAMRRLSEPIDPIRPAEIAEVRRQFAEPISAAETIARRSPSSVRRPRRWARTGANCSTAGVSRSADSRTSRRSSSSASG